MAPRIRSGKRNEQKFVFPILGQPIEIKTFHMSYPVVHDQIHVNRKGRTVWSERPLFDRFGVGTDHAYFFPGQITRPVDIDSGSAIREPVVIGFPILGKSRADQHRSAFLDVYPLRFLATLDVLAGDSVTVRERFDAVVFSHVQQNASKDNGGKVFGAVGGISAVGRYVLRLDSAVKHDFPIHPFSDMRQRVDVGASVLGQGGDLIAGGRGSQFGHVPVPDIGRDHQRRMTRPEGNSGFYDLLQTVDLSGFDER